MDILGDISGIRKTQLKELEELASLRTKRPELIDYSLLEGICNLSSLWNREIALYINRSGVVTAIAVGKHATVNLPSLPERQRRRTRCIHTHPSGNFQLSTVDLSALTSLGLESITSLGTRKGKLTGAEIGIPTSSHVEKFALSSGEIKNLDYDDLLREVPSLPQRETTIVEDKEKAYLIALEEEELGKEYLAELAELSKTAGVVVVGQLLQSRTYGSPVSYLGKGKLQELTQLIQNSGANVLICDDELTPVQLKNLENATGTKVLDRTNLILDIFAQRAKSREGKLQVELAQLKHLLPRLTGKGVSLSRLGGGVGTRGPGETKLEVDRRRLRQRINALESELKEVRKNRQTQRRQRKRTGLPLIALVGYTNAGKTTFMERAMEQTQAKGERIRGEDKLFATLDPIVRGIQIPSGPRILLSDTVGFIQKLPHQLLHAFLATLEEVKNADVLIHVLDASHPRALEQAETVLGILKELDCENKPQITLLNKIDKVEHEGELTRLAQELSHPIQISLLKNQSLAPVWKKIVELI
ncbi:MAG: GTPase HflX [Desulfitobacterium sp.]|nr:GTPase HflX [Desulfitobacterium sp.]